MHLLLDSSQPAAPLRDLEPASPRRWQRGRILSFTVDCPLPLESGTGSGARAILSDTAGARWEIRLLAVNTPPRQGRGIGVVALIIASRETGAGAGIGIRIPPHAARAA